MKILEILTEYDSRSLNRPFTYLYDKEKTVDKGFRVLITFNNRQIVGYVLSCQQTDKTIEELEELYGFKLHFIDDVLDCEALLKDDLLSLADEISNYYLSNKIKVLQTMLPPSLNIKKSSLSAPKIAYEKYLIAQPEVDTSQLTPKQLEIYNYIKNCQEILKSEIKSKSVVEKLIDMGAIKVLQKEKRRLKVRNYDIDVKVDLNEDQRKVIDEFIYSSDNIFLLQGVTGSGKTVVYLTICESYLKVGKTVLMLVPEIALTPMMSEYFLKRFSSQVAILHSELTPAQKYDEYRRIARGEAKIVVGVRSAIFAPLDNIGVIILDEEHVESYKQDTPPFYHARDVAIMRAKQHNAKVLLGSATPCLESKARAQKGVYHLLRLDKRINELPLPSTTIVDLSNFENIDRESYLFSLTLRRALEKVLANDEQAILLINRRGFSSSVSCRNCGHIFRCPTCGVPLTYHREENLLKCHHCDYMEVMRDTCPECGSKYLMKTGYGTERIVDELHRLYPSARVLRLDSDTAKARTMIGKTLEKFANKEADILVGTQMIAKGHNFKDVTLVGVVSADAGLSSPSYRSSERTFQLITQAVGRSGREKLGGQAIIQTYNPSNYAITFAARQDYDLFYKKEMAMRKLQFFPPYSYLVSLSISAKNEDLCIETIYTVTDILNKSLGDKAIILGPITPYIPYDGKKYKRSILIKYRDQKEVHEVLSSLLKTLSNKTQINILVNFDPYDF